MSYFKYNEFDLQFTEELFDLINDLDITEPTDEEVWYGAKEYDKFPVFENIFLDLLLDKIEVALYTKYPDIEFGFERFINAADTKWVAHAFGEEFWSLEQLENLIEDNKEDPFEDYDE